MPLDVPGPLAPFVKLATALPIIGSIIQHYMVILEINVLESQESGRKEAQAEAQPLVRETYLVICDFEPLDKKSPQATLTLLSGGEQSFSCLQRSCVASSCFLSCANTRAFPHPSSCGRQRRLHLGGAGARRMVKRL